MTEAEAQERIAKAFLALDDIYNLHAPKDPEGEVWECKHCNVQWPCETERIILDALIEPQEASEEAES